MQAQPTLIAVFERKSIWQVDHPALLPVGCDRFLEEEETIATIINEVSIAGIPVKQCVISRASLEPLFIDIRTAKNPLVWNITDGSDGNFLGSNIPAFVQLARLPHFASGSYAQMLCQHKHHLKAVAESIGVPVACGVHLSAPIQGEITIPSGLRAPYFVKPARLGNSVGDELIQPICADAKTAREAVVRRVFFPVVVK